MIAEVCISFWNFGCHFMLYGLCSALYLTGVQQIG
jgi:hypothetical protein